MCREREKGSPGASPLTREEAERLASDRASSKRILGASLDNQRRTWVVEVALDAGRRAEVEIDPTARAVISYAIRTEAEDGTDPVRPRP
jgi:hypothetical protein